MIDFCCEYLRLELDYDNEYSRCGFKNIVNDLVGIPILGYEDCHRLIKYCPFCGISISNRTQQEKELIELRKSIKLISEPDAVIEMRTMKIPERIQKNINKALRKGKNGEY